MIRIEQVQGAIYDVDDTLYDNGPKDKPEVWLHSRSRLAAIHEVSEKHWLPKLRGLTAKQNAQAFMTATTHSLSGAIWNAMYMRGVVSGPDIDTKSPMHAVLLEIAERKNQLHEAILREHGTEVAGAADFVRSMEMVVPERQALATMAVRRDIDIILGSMGVADCFPDKRIVSLESVTKPKPDPECFEKAFKSLDLPDTARRSVLAFDDNPRGLQSAKRAGLYVCAITQRFDADDPQLLAVEPDMIATSWQDFRQQLQLPS